MLVVQGVTAMMTVEQARKEYGKIRKRSHEESPKAFDAACAAHLVTKGWESTPENWLKAAKTVRFRCRRCAGTGSFITMVENGKPKGPGGACYRCGGKGWQDDADARRNFGADMRSADRAARAMFHDAQRAQAAWDKEE